RRCSSTRIRRGFCRSPRGWGAWIFRITGNFAFCRRGRRIESIWIPMRSRRKQPGRGWEHRGRLRRRKWRISLWRGRAVGAGGGGGGARGTLRATKVAYFFGGGGGGGLAAWGIRDLIESNSGVE